MLNSLKDWFDGDIAGIIHKEYKGYAREEKIEDDMRKEKKILEEKITFIKALS
jgi:hypothetical protein